ncbi:hypothetical protein KLP28_00030 [Nocardioidaceae bacterium]|nr:hypothetical protein KLP28_00030 [Nocardioidaceae bacterium]
MTEISSGIRVIGSGLSRAGTNSLKLALQTLLGGSCYHMTEVFLRMDDCALWNRALAEGRVDFDEVLGDFCAAVDFPASACWQQLAEAYPEALIVHTERPAEEWYASAGATVLEASRDPDRFRLPTAWHEMTRAAWRCVADDILDEAQALAGFAAWNDGVRATAPSHRLLVWHAGEGWGPLCEALEVPVPDEPFPHVNTVEEFRERGGLD